MCACRDAEVRLGLTYHPESTTLDYHAVIVEPDGQLVWFDDGSVAWKPGTSLSLSAAGALRGALLHALGHLRLGSP